ncbi:QcrA and Rieske domain-containing protein [Subtercola sp. YIM 133946]|uniref:QcrA and Rieske domain-containing protein n=1 Tax=Subtercola sp. YIM 133946 TaxID=3118909 RepID=UPI002F94626A
MTEKSAIPRRVILTAGSAGLAGASALALAACAPTSTTGSGSAAPAAPSAAATAPSTPSAAAGSGAGSRSSAATIAQLADIPVGGAKTVTFDGADILVGQPTAGTVVAYSSVCPHQGCAVAFAKTDFECPCHGSTFALATGDVTHGPAVTGLSTVAVKVDGDAIVAA